MRDPDEFDAFYKGARERLLLQTFALTGDLGASRSAVRDAFVVAWHHWRKLARLDDPEVSVRPHAWRQAQRRHTARMWHREKGIDPEVKDTLDALGKLSHDQRRALVLTQLASVSMSEMAREISLPLDVAERELQAAASKLALLRDVPTSSVRALFEPLAAAATGTRWPRPTIIRRAGAARRRTHTTVGAVAAVAALLVTGSLVTDAAGVRPTLDRTPTAAAAPEAPENAAPPAPALSEDQMLTAQQLDANLDERRWSVVRTDDGASADAKLPCQQRRPRDLGSVAALERSFTASTKQQPESSAVQATDLSPTKRAARRTFATRVNEFAACTDSRVQLIATRTVESAGDRAVQLVLRSWREPVSTTVVGVARTGRFTTVTVDSVESEGKPDVMASARVLTQAVDGLCDLPQGGGCASDEPRLAYTTPVPVGEAPALLSEVDLPPVSGIERPWAGTEPIRASANVAATRCDDASFAGTFRGARFDNNITRTFVIPKTDLADEFGLTETAGALPPRQSAAFVDDVRAKLASCGDKDLGTDVVRGTVLDEGDRDLTVWNLTTELSDDRSLRYSMAILRTGTSVAQLSFVESPDVNMRPGAFEALAFRALDRLAELPPPKR